ncbi:hypothetical protein A3H66_01745 [Candidatus Falkowbacteria bacterium RIFCSPLOWO2_02_FULL_45_21]|uniref:Peptidyl-tRNA hydrolase n=1 Tax=Candidatus Falkowbacteria bacterium RIFCSPLOWO2_02_FULL_45_21 TaxID=1797989 RepID=A0A1F5SC18_9BACT|nr:MAG: hypothetical protein A3H66_01745 [Candidatus Falkowbacteria bacterium RIFCSPLOWO2_02_FULL_45_21]
MRIIVGLGNPGPEYENTRHNIGFMALDALAKELGLKWENSKKFKAEIAKSPEYILVKPQNFMNNSGECVAAVLSYYLKRPLKQPPLDKGPLRPQSEARGWGDILADILTVIHDDLDIELGKLKISVDSRSAGHKGVESIISQLKTKNFKRIRIGVRTPTLKKIPADKFVLQKFNDKEKIIFQNQILSIIKTI